MSDQFDWRIVCVDGVLMFRGNPELAMFQEDDPRIVYFDDFETETISVPTILFKSHLLAYLTLNANNSMTLGELIEAIEHDLFLRIRDAGNDP